MKITKDILESISNKIINEYNDHLKETIGSLIDENLMSLHYMLVKVLLEYEEDDTLYEAITAYATGLPRIHRGYFWKILNYFDWNLSCRWYKHSRGNVELILYSLCPHSKGDDMLDFDSEEFKVRTKSLERVFDLTVKTNKYGLVANEAEHIAIPPTPKE